MQLLYDEASIPEPFQLLWYRYHALQCYVQDLRNPKDSRTHVNILLEFIKDYDMPYIPEIIQNCSPTRKVETISFPVLWCLYSPGTVVVTNLSNPSHSQTCVINWVTPPTRFIYKDGGSGFGNIEIEYETLTLQGTSPRFTTVRTLIVPVPLHDHRKLVDLEFVPLDVIEDQGALKQSLIARGRKYWNMRGQHMKEVIDRSQSTGSFGVGLLSSFPMFSYYFRVPIKFDLRTMFANELTFRRMSVL